MRRAGVRQLSTVPAFTPAVASSVHHFLRSPALADAERTADGRLRRLAELGCSVLHPRHASYPGRLRAIYDPPPLLFVLGSGSVCSGPCVAVVGTRRPSPYGLAAAEHFSRELTSSGAIIVSGLARGTDTRAHRAALDAGGTTVAVTGTGPDVCYPPENRKLMDEIVASGGAVISEHPPGTGAEPGNFPRRNRLISGLSVGVVVVESDLDGGAMITARLALDQDRDVFAVPGPIHAAKNRGCHALLRRGEARLASSAAELLEDLGYPFAGGAAGPAPAVDRADALSGAERAVAGLVGSEPVQIDELAGRSALPVPDLLVALLSLEMKNIVRQLPGKYFVRRF